MTDPGYPLATGTYIIRQIKRNDTLYGLNEPDHYIYTYSKWETDAFGQKVTGQLDGTYMFLNVGLDAWAYLCSEDGYDKICSGTGIGKAKNFKISQTFLSGKLTIQKAEEDSPLLWTVLEHGYGEVNITAPFDPQNQTWTFESIGTGYGLRDVTASHPSTALKFVAHDTAPILLLEDLDDLILDVVCLSAGENEHIIKSRLVWRTRTSRLGRLGPNIRHSFSLHRIADATWMISEGHGCIEGHGISLQALLTAKKVPLREIGSSFQISHVAAGVSSAWAQRGTIEPRLNLDHIFSFGEAFPFGARQQLLPINLGLASAKVFNVLDVGPKGLQVFCVDCVSRTNFSVGIEVNVTDGGTAISNSQINVTVIEFQQDIALEFTFDAGVSFTGTVDVLRLPLPELGVTIPDIGSIGFFFGGAVRSELEVTVPLNFTVGAKAKIPAGATATYAMVGGTSSATGWDTATFDALPFRLNTGSFNASAGVALAPFIEAGINLLDALIAQGRIYVNTPHIKAASVVQSNVNRLCQPVGPTDFESFATAMTMGIDLELSIEGSSSGVLLPDADVPLISHNSSLGTYPTIDAPKCFVVGNDGPGGGANAAIAGLLPAATGTLVAAAVAVPTFNIPGIQAYYASHKTLPTNVNYSQMVMATTVPDDLKKAIDGAASGVRLSGVVVGGWVAASCLFNWFV
ncbi:hypothetical protein C8J57DRAFT_1512893 [Mycena rebaudengoi]|nr:hypothetical protein C8J57DRAFT_1512893 [Mycena rebaudengoi]